MRWFVVLLFGCQSFPPGAKEAVEECAESCRAGGLVVVRAGMRGNDSYYPGYGEDP